MRILALDVGERRIGIAKSDPLGWTAQGVESWAVRGDRADVEHIAGLAAELGAEQVLVGLPRNMNGTYGPMTERIRAFGALVAQHTGLPVRYWDERLTTAAAQRTLLEGDVRRSRRKQVVDKLAACLLLQSYLDAQGKESC